MPEANSIYSMSKKIEEFPGLPENYLNDFWKYPRILDKFLHTLSGSEQKLLEYIFRHTIGFRKTSDKISLSQFMTGVGNLDSGTGLAKNTILKGLDGLVEKGFITRKKLNYRVSEYGLVVQGLNKSGSKNEMTGSKFGQQDRSKIEHTIEDRTIEDNTIKDIEKIYIYFCENICSSSRLTSKAKEVIAERLKEFEPEELLEAIVNFSEDEWQMENNSRRGVAWFFESEDKVERYKNLSS